jgi:glycolate oxidase
VLVAFDTLENAVSAVAEIFQQGLTPSAMEFMEKAAVRAAEERQGKTFPNNTAEAQLLIEVDGNHEGSLDEDIQTIAGVVEKYGAVDILLADDRQKVEDVWALRRGIGEAVKSISCVSPPACPGRQRNLRPARIDLHLLWPCGGRQRPCEYPQERAW